VSRAYCTPPLYLSIPLYGFQPLRLSWLFQAYPPFNSIVWIHSISHHGNTPATPLLSIPLYGFGDVSLIVLGVLRPELLSIPLYGFTTTPPTPATRASRGIFQFHCMDSSSSCGGVHGCRCC